MHRDVQVSRSTGRARATLGAAIPEQVVQYGPALDELAVADDDAFANGAQTLGEFFHQIH